MVSRSAWVSSALALSLLTACDLPPEINKYWTQLNAELNALIAVATGGQSPLAQVSPSPSPSPVAEEFSSPNARAAKVNAELLHEVLKVVFMREPNDRAEFGSLVDTLNQGASFEGMYNGFTHSADYRKLEMANQGASTEALRAFSEELAALEIELPDLTEFTAASAQPLAESVDPAADPGNGPVKGDNGVETLEFGGGKKDKTPPPAAKPLPGALAPSLEAAPKASPKPPEAALAESYGKLFVGSSIFTLKRVLGDEAQKVVAAKKDQKEKLAHWYGKFVVRLAQRNIDFQIPLRNKADEQFHYKWAMESTSDRLLWEVLNREHRVLNEANKQKQGGS